MKTRPQIAGFIENQLQINNKNLKYFKDYGYNRVPEIDQWHYGKCELRDLLDFIFDGKPQNKSDCLRNEDQIAKDRETMKQIQFFTNYGKDTK